MKCMHVCAAQKAYLLFTKLYIKPTLADEIAEPHPDMNIKVAAFTVSEKSSYTMFHEISLFIQLRKKIYGIFYCSIVADLKLAYNLNTVLFQQKVQVNLHADVN